MKAEEQTVLNEILSRIYKLDTEKLASLYNEAGDLTDMTAVIEADEKRVAKFTTEKNQQYNRGIKEGAGKIEKELKEKYGESELIGVDLIESIVVKQVEEATKTTSKDISKHPDFIKLQAEIDKKIKERDKEWTAKLEQKEAEFNSLRLFEKVKDKALNNLDSRKPILPGDPKKAQVWKDTYLNELKQYRYQDSEEGPIVLDKEGQVMKDTHGNIVRFDEFEKQIADKYFEYPVAEKRSSAGNQTQTTNTNVAGDVKTKAEALAKLKDPKITPEDRKKYTELFDNLKE